MKQKIKKAFESTVWWSGVIMVGLILGISLQVVKAWTEPSAAPPNGNVGAPINTSSVTQIKNGILSLVGLSTSYINVPGVVPVAGNVLTAQNASGQVAWAAGGGGGCYTSYTNSCLSGFTNKGSLGSYGGCYMLDSYAGSPVMPYYVARSPSGSCGSRWIAFDFGTAYLCCQ